jgi:hypothetical protein
VNELSRLNLVPVVVAADLLHDFSRNTGTILVSGYSFQSIANLPAFGLNTKHYRRENAPLSLVEGASHASPIAVFRSRRTTAVYVLARGCYFISADGHKRSPCCP